MIVFMSIFKVSLAQSPEYVLSKLGPGLRFFTEISIFTTIRTGHTREPLNHDDMVLSKLANAILSF